MFNPDEPIGYYCDTHCFENGACSGCYQFLSGCESFDFSQFGLCEDCEDALEENCRDGFDDENDYDYSDSYLY